MYKEIFENIANKKIGGEKIVYVANNQLEFDVCKKNISKNVILKGKIKNG